MNIAPHMAKGARHTIGARIESKLLDLLEMGYVTYFTERTKKPAKITECIFVLDIVKFLIGTAWEGKLIANKQCEDIAKKLDEVGRMFHGWKTNIEKTEQKNRPTNAVAS